jgi:peptidoglycan/LPS O-acetylase OafA/YrhL
MGLLRLLLAVSVVLHHSGPIFGNYLLGSFNGGSLPVNSFFIISGFYMGFILSEKYVAKNGSYFLFITNRFLRIYPIYWAVLIATILLVICLYTLVGNTTFLKWMSGCMLSLCI